MSTSPNYNFTNTKKTKDFPKKFITFLPKGSHFIPPDTDWILIITVVQIYTYTKMHTHNPPSTLHFSFSVPKYISNVDIVLFLVMPFVL